MSQFLKRTWLRVRPNWCAGSIACLIVAIAPLGAVSCSKSTHKRSSSNATCKSDDDCNSGEFCNTDTKLCEATPIHVSGDGGTDDPSTTGNLQPGDGGVQEVDRQVLTDLAQNACSGWTTELETLPAVLEFVIDTSYSMAEKKSQGTTWNLQGQGTTKWQITHDALIPAIDGLGASIAAGATFFPNHAIVNGQGFTTPQPVSACFDPSNAVPIDQLGAAGSAQRTALADAINAISPNGNTPTYEAYAYAVGQMQQATSFTGQKYMVLMTDGVPTFGQGCVGNGTENVGNNIPTDPIIQAISAAATAGIKTFVIGAPGSQDGIGGADARPWLSAAATAGQTATSGCSDTGTPNFCHMDMTQQPDFSTALRDGLGVISSQLATCQYAIPDPPSADQLVDLNQLNVFVVNAQGTFLVLPSTQADCTEGWRIVDNKIELCQASCDRSMADASASVQILAGCTTQEVIDAIPLL